MSERPTINLDNRGRVEDLTAIVTGASRGIGRSTAIALAREGANVVVNYRQMGEEAERVVDIIKGAGGEAFSFQADYEQWQ